MQDEKEEYNKLKKKTLKKMYDNTMNTFISMN